MVQVTPLLGIPQPRLTHPSSTVAPAPQSGVRQGPAPFDPLTLRSDNLPVAISSKKANEIKAELHRIANQYGLSLDTDTQRVQAAILLKENIRFAFIVKGADTVYGDSSVRLKNSELLRNAFRAYLIEQSYHRGTRTVFLKDQTLVEGFLKYHNIDFPDPFSIFAPKNNEEASFYDLNIKPIYEKYQPATIDSKRTYNPVTNTTTTTYTKRFFENGNGSQLAQLHAEVSQVVANQAGPIALRVAKSLATQIQIPSLLNESTETLGDLVVQVDDIYNCLGKIYPNEFSVYRSPSMSGGFIDASTTETLDGLVREPAALNQALFYTPTGVVESTYLPERFPQLGYVSRGDYRIMAMQVPGGEGHGVVVGKGDDRLIRLATFELNQIAQKPNSDEQVPLDKTRVTNACKDINDTLQQADPAYLKNNSATISTMMWWPGAHFSTLHTAITPDPVFSVLTFDPKSEVVLYGVSASNTPENILLDSFVSASGNQSIGSAKGPLGETTYFGKRSLTQYELKGAGVCGRWTFWMSKNIEDGLRDIGYSRVKTAEFADANWYYPVDHIAKSLFDLSKQSNGFLVVSRMVGYEAFPASRRGRRPQLVPNTPPTVMPQMVDAFRQRRVGTVNRSPTDFSFGFGTIYPYSKPKTGYFGKPTEAVICIDSVQNMLRDQNTFLGANRPGFSSPVARFLSINPTNAERQTLSQELMADGYHFAGRGNVFGVATSVEMDNASILASKNLTMVTLRGQSDLAARALTSGLQAMTTLGLFLPRHYPVAGAISQLRYYAESTPLPPNSAFDMISYRQNGTFGCCFRVKRNSFAYSNGDYALVRLAPGVKSVFEHQSNGMFFGAGPDGKLYPQNLGDFTWTEKKFSKGLYAMASQSVLQAANGPEGLASMVAVLGASQVLPNSKNIAKLVLNQLSVTSGGVFLIEC